MNDMEILDETSTPDSRGSAAVPGSPGVKALLEEYLDNSAAMFESWGRNAISKGNGPVAFVCQTAAAQFTGAADMLRQWPENTEHSDRHD